MSENIKKAYAISDAKISFVSLVDKAANKKRFLITKSDEDGKATFQTSGRILKYDKDAHYVTGIVYEPMTEDSHGNYMTEDEITKAAYWYAKNSGAVDLQHSFKALESATVVESYVAKCDMEIDGEPVKKGTWLMTVEVNDDAIFDSIQKGEITGFSMGGYGIYSTVDEELPVAKEEGALVRLLKRLGFVQKGEVADRFNSRMKECGFWEAFNALECVLYRRNYNDGTWTFAEDEATIREALSDFNMVLTNVLTNNQPILNSLYADSVTKAGKAMSGKNKDKLQAIHDELGEFLSMFAEPTEESEENTMITKEDAAMIAKAVADAMNGGNAAAPETPAAPVQKEETPAGETPNLQQLVKEEVQKAMQQSDISGIVKSAVDAAINPILKAVNLPTNLNDYGEGAETVQKSEQHYLHGIL